MKVLVLTLSVFSVALFAEDFCEGLKVHASLLKMETDPKHPCKPEMDDVKDRIVVRKPGYEGLTTLEEVGAHEINNRKWCGQRHSIAKEFVKSHFLSQFHPGKLVSDLMKHI